LSLEIKSIQRKLGITTIYVTHDQEEAMAVSDRIAIQNKGAIVQVGTPKEIYDKPENLFIATFIGKGALIEGMVEEVGETIKVNIGASIIEGVNTGNVQLEDVQHVACVIRPESFFLDEPDVPCNVLEGVIEWYAFVGPIIEVKIIIGSSSFMIDAPTDREYVQGEKLTVYVPKAKTIVLPWMG
ncbi:ABC transporter ATP-binding protein, partial [Candidatus Bathyarchaeota archaeon]|nr:ABC transporter ATP-binding protein [Candidatus Bathyarchaeota archaeon]